MVLLLDVPEIVYSRRTLISSSFSPVGGSGFPRSGRRRGCGGGACSIDGCGVLELDMMEGQVEVIEQRNKYGLSVLGLRVQRLELTD
jgi:hypothetical protein